DFFLVGINRYMVNLQSGRQPANYVKELVKQSGEPRLALSLAEIRCQRAVRHSLVFVAIVEVDYPAFESIEPGINFASDERHQVFGRKPLQALGRKLKHGRQTESSQRRKAQSEPAFWFQRP